MNRVRFFCVFDGVYHLLIFNATTFNFLRNNLFYFNFYNSNLHAVAAELRFCVKILLFNAVVR